MELESRIEELLSPFIEKGGLSLYDVEFQGRVLRISIEKPGGVTVDDCVEVSRLINPMLDVEDIIPGGRYELEVSSPGLNRPLRKSEHFAAAVGSRIHVTTLEPLSKWNVGDSFEKRKNITGELKEFNGSLLTLLSDGQEVTIPFEAVTKSRVEFELKITPPPGKGKKD